jgi:hypothetical protein
VAWTFCLAIRGNLTSRPVKRTSGLPRASHCHPIGVGQATGINQAGGGRVMLGTSPTLDLGPNPHFLFLAKIDFCGWTYPNQNRTSTEHMLDTAVRIGYYSRIAIVDSCA